MQSTQRTQETSVALNSTRIPLESYGIAFELHTVLHRQWRYDTNWVKKLQDFDLLTHYNKRKLCESALQSLGYDPKRIPCTADPGYGHSQHDTSGEADAQDYEAQINALMDGRLPPSLGPSSSGTTSTGLSGGFPIPMQLQRHQPQKQCQSLLLLRPVHARLHSKGDRPTRSGRSQDVMKDVFPMTPTPFRQQMPSFAADFTASLQESL